MVNVGKYTMAMDPMGYLPRLLQGCHIFQVLGLFFGAQSSHHWRIQVYMYRRNIASSTLEVQFLPNSSWLVFRILRIRDSGSYQGVIYFSVWRRLGLSGY